MFPFILPSFAPTAVPLVLPFFSGSLRPLLFRAFPFFFRFLSSASFPVLTTQPSVLPFPFFPFLPLSGFFGAPLSLSFLRFSPFSPAWSPVRSFPVPVLGFLFVSFRPSSLRFPQLFHECFPFAFAFGLFHFPSGSFRPLLFRLRLLSLLPLPFRFFLSPPHSWLPQCSASALASSVFPRSSQPGFPCFLSRFFVLSFLFVSFHPSRFRSHSRSTGASLLFRFLSSASLPGFSACFLLSFVRFSLLLTTQPSALSFPFFPFSPGSGSFGARPFLSSLSLSSSVSPVSMRPFRFRYSASCVSFLRFSVSCHRHYAASGLLFPARPFPLAFALGSGYLACLF